LQEDRGFADSSLTDQEHRLTGFSKRRNIVQKQFAPKESIAAHRRSSNK